MLAGEPTFTPAVARSCLALALAAIFSAISRLREARDLHVWRSDQGHYLAQGYTTGTPKTKLWHTTYVREYLKISGLGSL